MAVTEDDFLQPEGELSLSLFPGETLESLTSVLINGWLQQAISKIETLEVEDEDGAAMAWVYHRAYTAITDRMMSSAASSSIDGNLSRSIAVDQRRFFADKAAAYLALWDSLTAEPASEPAVPVFFTVVKARRCCV